MRLPQKNLKRWTASPTISLVGELCEWQVSGKEKKERAGSDHHQVLASSCPALRGLTCVLRGEITGRLSLQVKMKVALVHIKCGTPVPVVDRVCGHN